MKSNSLLLLVLVCTPARMCSCLSFYFFNIFNMLMFCYTNKRKTLWKLETNTDVQTKTLHSFQQSAPTDILTAPWRFLLACTAVAARSRQSEVKGHKLGGKKKTQKKSRSKRLGLNGKRSRKQYVKRGDVLSHPPLGVQDG